MKNYAQVIPYEMIGQAANTNEIPAGVALIQAPRIWNETKGKGITIAVLDTGAIRVTPIYRNRL